MVDKNASETSEQRERAIYENTGLLGFLHRLAIRLEKFADAANAALGHITPKWLHKYLKIIGVLE